MSTKHSRLSQIHICGLPLSSQKVWSNLQMILGWSQNDFQAMKKWKYARAWANHTIMLFIWDDLVNIKKTSTNPNCIVITMLAKGSFQILLPPLIYLIHPYWTLKAVSFTIYMFFHTYDIFNFNWFWIFHLWFINDQAFYIEYCIVLVL